MVLEITEQQKQLFDAVNILIDNQLTSVQDLYNDGNNLYVIGKMGNEMDEPSLVFANQYDDKIYSGVDGMFDDELDEKITHGMVGEEWKDDNTQS